MKKRIYELIYKLISVKGLLFAATLALIFVKNLDPFYGFLAGVVFVGSREAFKLLSVYKSKGNE